MRLSIPRVLIIIFSTLLFPLSMNLYCRSNDGQPYIATIDDDGIQRIKVLGGEYFFRPRHIVVKVNIPVEITIRKEASIIPHNFVIKALGAGIEVRETIHGNPKTIFFTPTRTGKYPFYCDKKLLFFKSHREKGMEGILEVRH